jgi:hypothetical protein
MRTTYRGNVIVEPDKMLSSTREGVGEEQHLDPWLMTLRVLSIYALSIDAADRADVKRDESDVTECESPGEAMMGSDLERGDNGVTE